MNTEINEFKASLEGMSVEELKKVEQEIIEKAEAIDKEIVATNFDLPTENYEVIAEAVRYFLNKQQVQWQYTLGMIGMYDFWTDTCPGKIPFPHLDSVLRALGSMQFTGYDEWSKVVAINKYFEPLRVEYASLTEKAYVIAEKHQIVMDKLGLNTPVETAK